MYSTLFYMYVSFNNYVNRKSYCKHMLLLVSTLLLTTGTLINVSMVLLLMVVTVLVLSVSSPGFSTVTLFVNVVCILVSPVDVLLKLELSRLQIKVSNHINDLIVYCSIIIQ